MHRLTEFLLHSDTNESSFVYSNQDSNLPPSHCTYALYGIADGFWHATSLLNILVDVSTCTAESYHSVFALQDHTAWIFESLLLSHDLWKFHPMLQSAGRKYIQLAFSATHNLLFSPFFREQVSETMLRKGSTVLSLMCVEVIGDVELLSNNDINHMVCRCLLQLASICTMYESILKTVSVHVVPTIIAKFETNEFYKHLNHDFRV